MPWEHGQRRPATREDILRALHLEEEAMDAPEKVDALAQAVNRLSYRDWETVIEALGVESRLARQVWRLLAYPETRH